MDCVTERNDVEGLTLDVVENDDVDVDENLKYFDANVDVDDVEECLELDWCNDLLNCNNRRH